MGMIGSLVGMLFGGNRNIIAQTAEVFRPNAEKSAQRAFDHQSGTLQEFSREFTNQTGWFDSLIDGLNRLPRPAMALGTIALFVSAMYNPLWFAARMQGLVLVPDQLWWLLGAIVTFYFGARYQAKAMDAKKIMKLAPQVMKNLGELPGLAIADIPITSDTNEAVREFNARSN